MVAETGAHSGTDEIILQSCPTNGQRATAGNGTHVAFAPRSRRMVDEFHALALRNGGRRDGAPGFGPEYDKNYYGAFVFDPAGNKVEAVPYAAE